MMEEGVHSYKTCGREVIGVAEHQPWHLQDCPECSSEARHTPETVLSAVLPTLLCAVML